MYGFAPGWCYLGGLPQALAIPRRVSPRGPTPAGATLIGGALSLIAANPMPTGWYVVGRTPERMFALNRTLLFCRARRRRALSRSTQRHSWRSMRAPAPARRWRGRRLCFERGS
jgi:allophanate hydrolase subunit 1